MKTGNKIALFYTAITIGIISVVTVVFYFVATDYISRLYYSYLTEKAYATAQKHWEIMPVSSSIMRRRCLLQRKSC
jgi:two-component system sensor histidine kinase ArlS